MIADRFGEHFLVEIIEDLHPLNKECLCRPLRGMNFAYG
jgi:hypothetical protein